jgi:putative peptide zinc metalloprotease protein
MCDTGRTTHAGPTQVLPALSVPEVEFPDFASATSAILIDDDVRPKLARGTRLLGEFEGSGYREKPHLVVRSDGQVVRLPGLLHTLITLLLPRGRGAEHLSVVRPPRKGYRSAADVADALSRETGDRYQAEHIVFLLDRKLAPLGLTHHSDGRAPTVAKYSPFLALKFRTTVFGEGASSAVARLFAWLYFPLVLIPVLGAFVVAEMYVFARTDIASAMSDTLINPVSILVVLLLAIFSAAFHEVGHAAACRYGGVDPGSMGVGVYLVWPAFFTDITRTYELGRAGRLRADLGGVYFNAIFNTGLVVAYLGTGYEPLLVGFVAGNLEMVQQLLPSLRFDGYYIISDLAGIPDLFKYIGPILRHVLLRRPADPRLQELKTWPQRLVSVWVLLVIPALALQLGYIAWQMPLLVRTAVSQTTHLVTSAAGSDTLVLSSVSAAIQIAFLVLPIVGVAFVLWQIGQSLTRLVVRKVRAARAARVADPASAPEPRAPAVAPRSPDRPETSHPSTSRPVLRARRRAAPGSAGHPRGRHRADRPTGRSRLGPLPIREPAATAASEGER